MYAANETQTKAVVSVAEMARMVGLSRARFYQLSAHVSLAGLRRCQPPPVLQRGAASGLPRRPPSQLRHRRQAGPVLRPATAGRAAAGAEAEEGRSRQRRPACRPARRAEGPRAGRPSRLPRRPRPSRNCTRMASPQTPTGRCYGPFFCTCGDGIQEITWGDKCDYRPR